jgi:hypothetical protein
MTCVRISHSNAHTLSFFSFSFSLPLPLPLPLALSLSRALSPSPLPLSLWLTVNIPVKTKAEMEASASSADMAWLRSSLSYVTYIHTRTSHMPDAYTCSAEGVCMCAWLHLHQHTHAHTHYISALLRAFSALGRWSVMSATLSRFSTIIFSNDAGSVLAWCCRAAEGVMPCYAAYTQSVTFESPMSTAC